MKMTILLILSILCVLGAAVLVVLAFLPKKSKPVSMAKDTEPLPGGGGTYILVVEGMHCAHCKETVEEILNAFDGITAKADCDTGIVKIRYDGYPELELLDALKKAVEEAGYSVKEIE